MRISCQLVDASSGECIWAEHFDRNEQDIFDVQDELVGVLVGTLVGRLKAAGAEKARRKPPSNLAAYECVLRGNALPMGDVEAEAEAMRWYEKAAELDPNYGRAFAKLGHYVQLEWLRDMGEFGRPTGPGFGTRQQRSCFGSERSRVLEHIGLDFNSIA